MMARNGKVHPIAVGKGDFDRGRDLEMNHINHVESSRRKGSQENWKFVSRKVSAVSRWKGYTRSMRETPKKEYQGIYRRMQSLTEQSCVLDSDVEDLGHDRLAMYDTNAYMKPMPTVNKGEPVNPAIAASRALIIYFAKLARASIEHEQELDFEFIQGLLGEGADVNFTDRHGQTVLHEVARIWHVDVAKFIIENGGDVNKTDYYGRSPLHVAAAVDYPEMVEFLVSSKG